MAHDRALRLVQRMHDLVQQQPLPQHRRHAVGDLVGAAVLPGEFHRQHRRARPADQLRGKDVPLPFDGGAPPRLGRRHDTRREQGHNAPFLQVRHGLGAHLDTLALRILVMRERHRDHVAARHLVDGRQQ